MYKYIYIYFQLDSFAFDTCAKKIKSKQTENKNPIKLCEKLMNDKTKLID